MAKKLIYTLCGCIACIMAACSGGTISSVEVSQNTSTTGPDNPNEWIINAKVTVAEGSVELKGATITLNGTTDINDYSKVKIYYTEGAEVLFDEGKVEAATLLGEYTPAEGEMACDFTTSATLAAGEYIIWIAAEVAKTAPEGNRLDASIVSLATGGGKIEIAGGDPEGCREVLMIRKLLYAPDDNGSVAYRIPSMVVLPNGNIVTAIDRRWNSEYDLANRIDIIARISEDGGYTWSEEYPIAIAPDDQNGRGDCAMVVAANGDIVAAFVGGNGLWNSSEEDPISSFISRSSDGGKTWTPVEEGGQGDITSQIWGSKCKGDTIRLKSTAAFFGSGRGLCLTRQTGRNAGKNGRIMFVTALRKGDLLYNYTVYSDDNGRTWKVSKLAFSGGDESKVAELNDGTILMSVRRKGERGYVKSTDGGETWSPQATWSELNVNACNGDILEYTATKDGYDKNRTLQSLPTNDGTLDRARVSMYLSYDEGQTWQLKKQLFGGLSAYSTMVKLPDGTIAMYVEDQTNGVTRNYFLRFSLDWLTSGEDTYTPPTGK